MINILEKIKTYKLEEIESLKKQYSVSSLEEKALSQTPCRGFKNKLISIQKKRNAIIAEIKKASPSKGLIRKSFDVEKIAYDYEMGGAACLSVLTDYPSFMGKPEFLSKAREVSSLPLLRKDFLYDPYQVIESRALGADCILIIMASVSDSQAQELESAAFSFNMDVLVEVHDKGELGRALKLKSDLIGINNRDLKTFKIDLSTTLELAKNIPRNYTIVTESGFKTKRDLKKMEEINVKSFLIGESLMKRSNIKEAIEGLQK